MSKQSTRRTFIAAVGTGVALAGCTGSDGNGNGGNGNGGNGNGGNGNGGNGDGSTTGNGSDDSSPDQIEITLASGYPEGDPQYPTNVEPFKNYVEDESGGNITVQTFPDGEQGSDQELLQKVQTGSMLMGHASLNNTAAYVSAMNLKNLPLLIQNTETARNLFNSDTWREFVDPSYREAKMEPIGNEYVLDFRHIGVNPDVTENGWRTPDQSEGIEIRVAGSTIVKRAFEEVGASTVNVAWTETPQSMQEGVFDAVHVSRLAHCSYGFGEFEEYVTGPNIANAGHTLVMNKEYFDGLDETYQEVIKEGGQTASEEERELRNSAMEEAISCIEEGGADYIELSSDERSQWADAVGYKNSLWDDMIEEFGYTREDVNALAEAAGTA